MRSLNKRQSKTARGFTLAEMLTVVAIAALMMAVAVPNVTSMVRNTSMTNAKNLIKTALGQAQSYAVKEGVYAGIRFQKAANGKTYLVLIENARSYDWAAATGGAKRKGNYSDRYVAVPNAKPKPLPDGVGAIAAAAMNNISLKSYSETGDIACLENYQTFSVIFSPSGQLVSKQVEVQPRRNMLGELVDSSGLWVDAIFGPYDLTLKTKDALLSYDNFTDHYDVLYSNSADIYKGIWPKGFSTRNVTSSTLGEYVTGYSNDPAPWCMFNATEDYDNSNEIYYLSESSATSMFLYMEDELRTADENPSAVTPGRYTDFFAMSTYNGTGANKQEGCEHLVINRYTGELIDIQ